MDDVTFGCNGREAKTWRLHRTATAMSGVAIAGRSLMSMNACLFLICSVVSTSGFLVGQRKSWPWFGGE